MTIVADASALFPFFDADDQHHFDVRRFLEATVETIVVPAPVVTEVDYLLRMHVSIDAELSFLDSLIAKSIRIENLADNDLVRCREIVNQYRNLDLGVADASVVAMAERLKTQRILTFDPRHFRVVIPKTGNPFVILPMDEPGN